MGDFTDKLLEGHLANNKLSALLVTTNFSKINESEPVTMAGGKGLIPGTRLASIPSGTVLVRLLWLHVMGMLSDPCVSGHGRNRNILIGYFHYSINTGYT